MAAAAVVAPVTNPATAPDPDTSSTAMPTDQTQSVTALPAVSNATAPGPDRPAEHTSESAPENGTKADASQSTSPDQLQIKLGGDELRPPMVPIMADIFDDDPAIRYILSNLSEEKKRAYMPRYFNKLFRAASMNKGCFQEIGDFSANCIWMPPGRKIDNWLTLIPSGLASTTFTLGLGGVLRQMGDYQAKVTAAKKRVLKGRKFWYLFFCGTQKDKRRRGLAAKLIREWQEKVRTAEGGAYPIWLEATTEGATKLYERCGFETVGTLQLGKGKAGPDGRTKKGGEGVKMSLMLWDPVAEK